MNKYLFIKSYLFYFFRLIMQLIEDLSIILLYIQPKDEYILSATLKFIYNYKLLDN